MKKFLSFSPKGFTLIELLIVITIIGILAVALLPSVTGAPGKARDAQRKATLNNYVTAIETYYSDKGAYPDSGVVSTSTSKLCFGTIGTSTGSNLLDNYFQGQKAPADPQGAGAKAIINCVAGQYFYCRLAGVGTNKSNYYIASYVESEGSANYTADKISTCGTDLADPPVKGAFTATNPYVYVISK